jgi:DNA-binding response OmpR family regulator
MSEKVLVVEDEPVLCETLAYNLKKEGYTVETARDGQAALETARRIKPDILILDLMLPILDGFEVCRILRQEMSMPILMLTARDDEIDRVIGLELGADDYMAKPFSMRELQARVKALLRRVRMDRSSGETQNGPIEREVVQSGNLVLDMNRRQVFRGEETLDLKPKEFELLLFLVQNRGKLFSREQILERVWGWEHIVTSRTVDVHMRWLREKIESDPTNPVRIITVRGTGYRFEG